MLLGHRHLKEGEGHVVAGTLPAAGWGLHLAGELELRHLVSHDDSTGAASDMASDGVGVAVGAEVFLRGEEVGWWLPLAS